MTESQSVAPPREILARLRLVCMELPEAVEESAWEGIRWCVRGKNFAQVLMIADGRPEAYARAAGTDGPACVLTFRRAPTGTRSKHCSRTVTGCWHRRSWRRWSNEGHD